jgi:hypothetical protein
MLHGEAQPGRHLVTAAHPTAPPAASQASRSLPHCPAGTSGRTGGRMLDPPAGTTDPGTPKRTSLVNTDGRPDGRTGRRRGTHTHNHARTHAHARAHTHARTHTHTVLTRQMQQFRSPDNAASADVWSKAAERGPQTVEQGAVPGGQHPAAAALATP